MHDVYAEWNKGELDSYLIDITQQIFAKKDDDGGPGSILPLYYAGATGIGYSSWLSTHPGRSEKSRRGGPNTSMS